MNIPGGFSVEIKKDYFQAVGKKIEAGIPAGLELTGMGIERVGKQDSHVDTGRYRSSIGHSTDMLTAKGKSKGVQINSADAIWKLAPEITFIWLYIGTNVEYAADLERKFGTLLTAMNKCKDLFLAALRETLKGTIII